MNKYGNGDKDKKKKKKSQTSDTAPGKVTNLEPMKDIGGKTDSMVKTGSKKYSTYKGRKTEWTYNGVGWVGRPVKKPDYVPPKPKKMKKGKAKKVPAMKQNPGKGMTFFNG